MPKLTVSKLAQLMADEKVTAIINATKAPAGLTPKQIAKATQLPTNQLYYTIKKMLAADLLTVVKQTKVKNLDEYYYSSYLLTEQPTNERALMADYPDITDIAPNWTTAHFDEMTRWLLYLDQQFLTSLTHDFKEEPVTNPDESTIMLANADYQLSAKGRYELRQAILKLMADAKKNDPDPEHRAPLHLLIKSW